jgi:hypothetical protein
MWINSNPANFLEFILPFPLHPERNTDERTLRNFGKFACQALTLVVGQDFFPQTQTPDLAARTVIMRAIESSIAIGF